MFALVFAIVAGLITSLKKRTKRIEEKGFKEDGGVTFLRFIGHFILWFIIGAVLEFAFWIGMYQFVTAA